MDGMKVLIVEDEGALASLLVQALHNEGCEVALARDGIDCMNKVTGFGPDVIVMDIMMPKLDGIDTTRLIRRNHGYDSTVIVALSARTDSATKQEMLAAGADLFFDKPFVMSRLVEEIREAVATRAGFPWLRGKDR
ncbi:response regulator [bacterium]|nr:response regulator [bacterium]MBU1073593.1 response regulator [bacterium]MBU1674832.1 response regulator [bacterium]